ncbi:MAG: flagellar FlbD family protein [Epulopiscium sp.]|nr:flagellar FlbD family protein [Candidatus Epulonipiscium sp.]
MIYITKINDQKVLINADLIEYVESTPDTVITMTTGRKVVAKESIEELVDLTIAYKRKIFTFPA